jgi:predicted naringenin-chalcone synthase
MTEPAILSIGTANPSRCYPQEEIEGLLRSHLGGNDRARLIFENAGIDSRYLAVDATYYAEERRTQERNERYMEEAVPLGTKAVQRCLDAAGVSPADVDQLVIVSCTGIDTPGLDLFLARQMGFSPWLRRTSVLGMGCYGALPGLLRAREAASARPGSLALVLSAEICSLHFQPGDHSLENIVSSALFADGAAAALIGTPPASANGRQPVPRLVDSFSYCEYQTFDDMAFHLTDHGFRMKLSAYVPRLLASQVEVFVDEALARSGISRADVRHWAVHPGSSKILDHVQDRLGLAPDALNCSRDVLRRYGNMSSATVLFVLDEIQRSDNPASGDYGMMMSFGPGLTMEATLVQWK